MNPMSGRHSVSLCQHFVKPVSDDTTHLSISKIFISYRVAFMDKMLIRLEQSFIESAEKLNERFSEQDRVDLSQVMEANYEKIRLIML